MNLNIRYRGKMRRMPRINQRFRSTGAGEPEQGVFGSLEPEPETAEKKTGAGAAEIVRLRLLW